MLADLPVTEFHVVHLGISAVLVGLPLLVGQTFVHSIDDSLMMIIIAPTVIVGIITSCCTNTKVEASSNTFWDLCDQRLGVFVGHCEEKKVEARYREEEGIVDLNRHQCQEKEKQKASWTRQ